MIAIMAAVTGEDYEVAEARFRKKQAYKEDWYDLRTGVIEASFTSNMVYD